MTNYQIITEMLLKYGTPEIEDEVVGLVNDCIFKYLDIDKIELSDDTIYRCPWKNAIAKIEEIPILSEEEKEELLKAFQEGIAEGISSYSRRLKKNGERAETALY
jgi:hypothetical protein